MASRPDLPGVQASNLPELRTGVQDLVDLVIWGREIRNRLGAEALEYARQARALSGLKPPQGTVFVGYADADSRLSYYTRTGGGKWKPSAVTGEGYFLAKELLPVINHTLFTPPNNERTTRWNYGSVAAMVIDSNGSFTNQRIHIGQREIIFGINVLDLSQAATLEGLSEVSRPETDPESS